MKTARVMGRLGRLDDRVVPVLGRVLRGSGRATVASVELTGPPGRFVGRVLRRYPVVVAAGALIAVAVILIVWTGGDQPNAVRPKVSSIVPPLTGQELGPVPGASVASYLDAAALRREQLSSLPATQPVIAVVDFNGFLNPVAVPTVLGRQNRLVRIVRGFARVPPPANGPIHVLSTSSSAELASQLSAAKAAATTVLAQYQLAFRLYARHPTAQRKAAVSALSARARQARVDARGLSPTCGCIFSILVTGPAAALDQIADLPDVRVVDPAPPSSSLRQLAVVPLEPQVNDVVPALEYAGE